MRTVTHAIGGSNCFLHLLRRLRSSDASRLASFKPLFQHCAVCSYGGTTDLASRDALTTYLQSQASGSAWWPAVGRYTASEEMLATVLLLLQLLLIELPSTAVQEQARVCH